VWSFAAAALRDPRKYGNLSSSNAHARFEEFIVTVPNLQAQLLLDSSMAPIAGVARLSSKGRERWVRRWNGEATKALSDSTWRAVSEFDILATTERFDELADWLRWRLGWTAREAIVRKARTVAPRAAERLRPYICADHRACEVLARHVAPLDYTLHAFAEAQLTKQIGRMHGRMNVSQTAGGAEVRTRLGTGGGALATSCVWMELGSNGTAALRAYRRGRDHGRCREYRTDALEHSPRFEARDACVPGDQSTMELVWAEREGAGRVCAGRQFKALHSTPGPGRDHLSSSL
jgi:hypothetical protein